MNRGAVWLERFRQVLGGGLSRPPRNLTGLFGTALVAGLIALAAGCSSQTPPSGAPPAPEEGVRRIAAVEPIGMGEETSRRPMFRWQLPTALAKPDLVTFSLYEVGRVADPRRETSGEKRLATATGLAADSPVSINLWEPPTGCVLTGDIRDMTQLAPETWYRWNVRAIGGPVAMDADFFFRTRAEAAVVGAGKKPAPNSPLPPKAPQSPLKPLPTEKPPATKAVP